MEKRYVLRYGSTEVELHAEADNEAIKESKWVIENDDRDPDVEEWEIEKIITEIIYIGGRWH